MSLVLPYRVHRSNYHYIRRAIYYRTPGVTHLAGLDAIILVFPVLPRNTVGSLVPQLEWRFPLLVAERWFG